ncbi:YhcU family protein [Bacillus timonensis]|nr:YhcU family protein [Bacillus timonensis]
MKVVYASTPEQETHIKELVEYIYTSIFPEFFSDHYISKLEALNVLLPNEEDLHYNGTLKDAFYVISSLQAIIAVLDTVKDDIIDESHRDIFEKNVRTLEDYGYSFPLTIEQFSQTKHDVISKYSKPTNVFLA